MQRWKPVPWKLALSLVASIALWSGSLPNSAFAQVVKDDSPAARANFTGSLTVRQSGGTLYYKIFILRGKVIGGYDTWKGSADQYHRIVGGWYDGKRMALLIQSTRNDLTDKWHSHAHHFEREGDTFTLKHTLYGFGKTMNKEVYKPHAIEEAEALTSEAVERLANPPAQARAPVVANRITGPDKTAEKTDDAKLKRRLKRLKRKNAELARQIEELTRERATLRRQFEDDR